ncbi:MAG: tyrosine-type recombinase/integrase [Campylobacterales bacterium]|nr:tyrosine-type recombinase/integrase [Campylobacterales bacterium]
MKEQFYKYLDQFLIYLTKVKNYSKLTTKTYELPIRQAIELCEIYEENSVVVFDLKKYRVKIAFQKNKTINKKISSIRSFVNYLHDQNIPIKLLTSNSVKSAQTLPKPIETDKIFESLNHAQLEEKLIVAMVYSLGVRISELASIKLENIQSNFIIVKGKGNKERQLPLNDLLKQLLEIYLKTYEPGHYLFEKENKPYSSRQLQYKIQKSFEAIGLKVTPHQLRHSFATDLLNNGARINDISLLLGHSSLKATGIYTKLNTNIKLKQYNNSHPLSTIR